MKEDFFRCSNCLMVSTRPRISFNDKRVCNACQYHIEKQTKIDWNKRQKELEQLCDLYRSKDNTWDIIIPCSGGKDSTYVADKLLSLGMHPLTVSFAPQIPSWLDKRNWENFVYTGFDNILITPNVKQYKKYAKEYLIRYGLPRQPFVTGISTAIIDIANKFNIKFIMFAENGEIEYGGADTRELRRFSNEFLTIIYYEGQDDNEKYGQFWKVPTKEVLSNIFVTWLSYFEDWEPELHAKLAVSKYGMEMPVGGQIGTFTNYSQISDSTQDLHMYLAFLKFGFGRCCADASIEIRRGRLNRSEGLRIVNELDGAFPYEYLDLYLDYFEMNTVEFFNTLDKFTNKDILYKTNDPIYRWRLKENG